MLEEAQLRNLTVAVYQEGIARPSYNEKNKRWSFSLWLEAKASEERMAAVSATRTLQ